VEFRYENLAVTSCVLVSWCRVIFRIIEEILIASKMCFPLRTDGRRETR
jgi:hypothetical protein